MKGLPGDNQKAGKAAPQDPERKTLADCLTRLHCGRRYRIFTHRVTKTENASIQIMIDQWDRHKREKIRRQTRKRKNSAEEAGPHPRRRRVRQPKPLPPDAPPKQSRPQVPRVQTTEAPSRGIRATPGRASRETTKRQAKSELW